MSESIGIGDSVSGAAKAEQICNYVDKLEKEIEALRTELSLFRLMDEWRTTGAITKWASQK